MDKEKKTESLRFLLAAGSKIYGEKKLMEMLGEQGAPKRNNLEELVTEIHEFLLVAVFQY